MINDNQSSDAEAGHAPPGGDKAAHGHPRRRVRMTREAGQSLVISSLVCSEASGDGQAIEIRMAQVCAGGAATLDVLLPDHFFVERKETLDGVQALFRLRSASGELPTD